MNRRIQSIVSAVFVVAGLMFLVTGIGGGGFDFKTEEWFITTRTSPTENRIVGAMLIAFGLLLSRLKAEDRCEVPGPLPGRLSVGVSVRGRS